MRESDPTPDSETIARTATNAAHAAGGLLRRNFRTDLDSAHETDDVTTATDRAAEDAIRETIGDRFPDHAIDGEERGRTPGESVEWLIDPIDGTNNYAIGHPAFAVAVAARSDRPLAAAIHEPLTDETLVAAADRGAYRLAGDDGSVDPASRTSDADDQRADAGSGDRSAGTGDDWLDGGDDWPPGERLAADHDRPLAESTVSVVVGIDVVRDDRRRARADAVRARLDDRAKRTLSTWAPCVDWGLLARGDTAGIVCYAPDDREQVPGELVAREAGIVCEWRGDWFVGACSADTLERLRETLPEGV